MGERPGRDVEVVRHGNVHESARVPKGSRDVALAGGVLGEDQVAGPAHDARAFAGLDLEDTGGEEDELAPRRVVEILHVAFVGLAEEHRSAAEGLRHRPRAGHRHLAQLDRRFSRRLGVDPEDAHALRNRGLTPNYSALMPAALIIGHHFSISALWNAARPSGVCSSREAISSPRSARRARTAGSASAWTIASFSFEIGSFGVPLGANNPNQPAM